MVGICIMIILDFCIHAWVCFPNSSRKGPKIYSYSISNTLSCPGCWQCPQTPAIPCPFAENWAKRSKCFYTVVTIGWFCYRLNQFISRLSHSWTDIWNHWLIRFTMYSNLIDPFLFCLTFSADPLTLVLIKVT